MFGSPAINVSKSGSRSRITRSCEISRRNVPPDAVTVKCNVVSDLEGARTIIVDRDGLIVGNDNIVDVGEIFKCLPNRFWIGEVHDLRTVEKATYVLQQLGLSVRYNGIIHCTILLR